MEGVTDLLPEIFVRLPFEERLSSIPLVCKKWKEACEEQARCWTSADMEPWFAARLQRDHWWEFECDERISCLIRKIVDRSKGMLQNLRTMHCSDFALLSIAHRCPRLVCLGIRNSLGVTDASMITLATMCPKLEYLDISDCYNISSSALEALGRKCPGLVHLKRNMLLRSPDSAVSPPKRGGDEEAVAIAGTMGGLRHLEMKRSGISDAGLMSIAHGCRLLEHLDVSLCLLTAPAVDAAAAKLRRLSIFIRPACGTIPKAAPDRICWYE